MDLYPIFIRDGVTYDIVWKLTKDHVEHMGLNVGQKIRYFEAVDAEADTGSGSSKTDTGSSKGMLFTLLKS